MRNYQAAEKTWLLILGVHLHPAHPPAHATATNSIPEAQLSLHTEGLYQPQNQSL